MWIEFKNYQEKAIVKLKQEVNELLDVEGNKICIFKSPTGSGKTLMMAEFLKRLIDSRIDGKKFSFIWIAVNKLHDQSRNSLKKYYDQFGVGLKCSYFEDLDERKIGENEILFLNWASINKKGNIYVRENERDNNLSNIVARTKDEGRIIILVIDESHRNAETEKSKELIDDIGPKITIEVSATPQLKGVFSGVEVELRAAKDEGMIKKEIVINPGFESFKLDKKLADKTADEIVVETALKKRTELAKFYEAEESNVNPLMLIQIPDARRGMIDKKDSVVQLLAKYGITTENGRLAIYLSDKDNKINLENIEKNENEVEVMIFKQAIAVGWDCPRAAILVLFREWKSMVFSIQTIGRIMRMPEHEHYKNPELNIGYVYTSLSNIGIAEDIAKEYITVFEGKRREDYEDIDLTSYHSKRFREETRLSSDFVPIFFQAVGELKLKERISLKHSVVDTKLIASGKITDVDKETKSIEKKGTLDIPKNEVELQDAFDYFARENLEPFAPELRSIKRINDSLYRFFDKSFKMGVDDWPKIQAIVLAEENRQAVVDVINRAKELYQEVVGKEKHEVVQNDEPWNVSRAINYNLSFVKKDYKCSIIQPYYAKTESADNLSAFEEDSGVEVAFIEYLERAKKVKWWFKNGRQDGSYFAVPYIENGQEKPFYLDFIVMLSDGRLGLFDTKGGIYAKTAKDRAEGLAEYIAAENKNGKNLFGGIVLKDKNSWRYHDSKKYAYDPDDLKDWKFLDLN
ncbi:MAG: Type III restriction enzyme, res subunit superfamily [Candidatus Woesebacteria bacterium GW2011_GWB1_44_11b]|uniref:Type III restriction enzyme, res subunit superfamily n=1 Tax=Candidatus Woesebacteria bacterium GW2011_GWB1_44_11b TaxID=1618580 RepID=A0A0G1GFE4_9BACT|nr:MAG: Type III restriction enzyme, res subunit superfamily [Candidatus Woesebacteria bacterium GW2011_GWB1_44_11b]